MPEIEFVQVLPKMIGERITTYCDPPDSAYYPPRDWIIINKLDEESRPITQSDFASGMGPAFTAGKYLCRPSAGNENKLAFMRIYKQIPLDGTRLDSSSVRKAQASNLHDHGHVELDALKHLTESGCTVTPRLLGYQIGKQDANDLVPGGYILHLVWERVPGDPLDIDEFWSLPYDKREFIRDKFKKAYTEVLKFGYQPILPSPSKIILDKTTGDIKISGFRRAARVDPDARWKDYNFAMFLLVLNSTERDKYHPVMAEDIKHAESNGWRW